jgi:hypothetical protein
MKKISVIVLVVLALLMAGIAEAAPKKKRTRNANRIGPYAGAIVSMTSYSTEQDLNEENVINFFEQQGIPFSNVVESTDDSDIGYEAVFGYRFHRYFAAELGLLQVGELESRLTGDFGPPDATVPGYVSFEYGFGGPVFSAIGILPLNDKFEFYARGGLLFAGADRSVKVVIDGDGTNLGGTKGDSSDFVYGAGFQYHVNVMFSIRTEYMLFKDVGDPNTTGTEDLSNIGLGLVVRF